MGDYRAALRVESVAGEQAMNLLARLSERPAASLGVVAAKQVNAMPEAEAHPVDRHVGRQIAAIRVQSDVSQAQLARAIGISFQQLQKYENARNRVSASMLHEIARSLNVPVGRFFQGLEGEAAAAAAPLPVDERLEFIASAEGRRLIAGLMQLPPGVRRRVSSLIAALGEEIKGPHCG
nr:helix-turn-helix transcriptional regulator [Mesorhizobium loti]